MVGRSAQNNLQQSYSIFIFINISILLSKMSCYSYTERSTSKAALQACYSLTSFIPPFSPSVYPSPRLWLAESCVTNGSDTVDLCHKLPVVFDDEMLCVAYMNSSCLFSSVFMLWFTQCSEFLSCVAWMSRNHREKLTWRNATGGLLIIVSIY